MNEKLNKILNEWKDIDFLSEIYLSDQDICFEEDELKLFIDIVKNNKNLISIDLSNNKLTDNMVIEICKNLPVQNKIEKIDFSYNHDISDWLVIEIHYILKEKLKLNNLKVYFSEKGYEKKTDTFFKYRYTFFEHSDLLSPDELKEINNKMKYDTLVMRKETEKLISDFYKVDRKMLSEKQEKFLMDNRIKYGGGDA